MTNEGQAHARIIIGVIGNIISFGLFIFPVLVFKRIVKKKSTEDLDPLLYLLTTMNCLLWGLYGLPFVHPDSTLVITINGVGLALEVCYLSIFLYYTTRKYRVVITVSLSVEAIVLAGLLFWIFVKSDTHENRSMVVGVFCVVFGIFMKVSPLSILRTSVQTESTEFLPFWLCLAGFLNSVTWFTYAQLKTFDLYLTIGNGIGGVLGAVQLIVYGYYTYCGKPPSEIQIAEEELPPV